MNKHDASEKGPIPNHRLREERERRGLAQKDVAEKIGLPDTRTVGRWERGVSFPQPYYRQKLCELFGKSAEELGLVKTRDSTDTQQTEPTASESNKISEYIWNIPSPFTSFIGREQDIAAVSAMLRQTDVRLVTLLGPGGVGKTRLSIQVASEMRKDFAAGAYFTPLASVSDPLLVMPTIAQGLGMQEGGTQSIVAQIKSILRGNPFLLVLDNFEQVASAAPSVEELLSACPELKVLVTSRAVLHIQAEYEYQVEPLALPNLEQNPVPENFMEYAAVALFVRRAQAFLPTFQLKRNNALDVGEICARLDGLPLAIEMAAARIKLLPPRALVKRLPQRLHLLKSDLQAQSERQQSLYNTIRWSYELLDEDERWLFRHLSVFPGGCTLEAAEALLGNGRSQDILDTIASLIDKSFLRQVEQDGEMPRFVMLETVRGFGLDCLQVHEEEEESRRVQAIYYLAFVEQLGPYLSGPQQAKWLAQLEQEKENLRASITWLIQHRETNLALRFCEPFGKFCGLRGYWGEEQHWLSAVLDLPWSDASTAIRARVLRRAGHLAYRLRDFALARSLLEESVALSRSVEDQQNLAGALVGLGLVLYRQKDVTSADRLLRQSVEAARESGDTWAIANSMESLGRLMHLQGNIEEALQLLNESVALSRMLGDNENLARILTTLASIEIAHDNIPLAATLARESYALAQELGTKPLKALALDSLGEVALALGEYDRAVRCFEERISLARELGDTPTVALQKVHLGEVALAKGHLVRSEAYIQDSLRFFREQGDRPNIAGALSVLGDIKRMQGESKEATDLYTEALLLDMEGGHNRGIHRLFIGLATAALEKGQLERAAHLFGFEESWTVLPGDLHPAQRLAYERAREYARDQLKKHILTTAWSEGRLMTLEEALALAMQ